MKLSDWFNGILNVLNYKSIILISGILFQNSSKLWWNKHSARADIKLRFLGVYLLNSYRLFAFMDIVEVLSNETIDNPESFYYFKF